MANYDNNQYDSVTNPSAHVINQPGFETKQAAYGAGPPAYATSQAVYVPNQPVYLPNQPAYITNQPIMVNPLHQSNENWRAGFCDCCDDLGQCCYAYWCWPCFLCSLTSRINEPCISCWCVPGALMMYRMKVRTAFHIQGDSCSDFLSVHFCPCCSALQMRNELTRRGFA